MKFGPTPLHHWLDEQNIEYTLCCYHGVFHLNIRLFFLEPEIEIMFKHFDLTGSWLGSRMFVFDHDFIRLNR